MFHVVNGKVTISLTKEQGKGKLSVHNAGNLIDKADLPRIFDRFYRGDKSRAQGNGGHGLGLSIANIVDAHGGKLTVTSSAEQGTMFAAEFREAKGKSMFKKRGIVLLIDEIDDIWLQLCKEANLNVLGVHEVIMEKPNSVQKVLNRLTEKPVREQLARFEKAGIEVEYELHAVEWLIPRDLFASAPALFRQTETGERVAENNCCVSNPLALEMLSERAGELAKRLGQAGDNYYFWMDDAENATCRCEKCRELSGADQNMKMMNAIAEGLTSKLENAKTAYLAYADALTVPKIKPHPSLFLEFAPIFRNHFEPITSGDPKNTKYRILLLGLLEIFSPGDAHILEYWLDNAFFSTYKKPPVKVPFDSRTMQADAAFYRSLGIDFVTSFGSWLDQGYRTLHGTPPIVEYGNILRETLKTQFRN